MSELIAKMKRYSHSRRMGMFFGVAYIVCALHTVIWLGKDFPDMPPILSFTILGLYGFNTAKAVANSRKVNNET